MCIELHVKLPWTTAPSFGRSYPSPSFNVFFRTFLSLEISVTVFQETNSRVIWRVALGGIAPSSPTACLPVSPNASIRILITDKIIDR